MKLVYKVLWLYQLYLYLHLLRMSVQDSQVGCALAPPPSPAVLDTMVRIIMGQTEMTHDEVVKALEQTNYDLKRVIRQYIRGDSNFGTGSSLNTSTSTSNTSSTNQLRFSEIRNFMDKSDALYYRRQEMTKIYNQVHERKKAAATAAAANEMASTSSSSNTESKL